MVFQGTKNAPCKEFRIATMPTTPTAEPIVVSGMCNGRVVPGPGSWSKIKIFVNAAQFSNMESLLCCEKKVENEMKKRIIALVIAGAGLVTGCSQQQKDKGIKGNITMQAIEEIAFAGVNYTVDEGVVYVTGRCPSQREKDKVLTRLGQLAGVKKIVETIELGPITLDENYWVKRSADSILKDYPKVSAILDGGQLYLNGYAEEKDQDKILSALEKLNIQGVNQVRSL